MRTNSGAIWAAIIALFLGVAVVTQFRSQDVYSRSLNLETPSSLTTLIANLSETNNELRNEIFDLRRDVADARDSVANGKGTLTEAQRQLLRHAGPFDRGRWSNASRAVDGSSDRCAGCGVCRDDPDRRHHRSVRAHLPKHPLHGRQRDRFG